MSNIAIRVENLSKFYKIGARRNRHDTLRDHLAHGFKSLFSRNGRSSSGASQPSTLSGPQSAVSGHPSSVDGRSDTFWALKDVSFEIKHGEVVGIIGRNGAGKSTLLKILSRITEPSSGFAEIHGRVASLLEVGTGFHAELTGRENIYLNGAVLGMKKTEIDRKFDEIVAFSEIEKFIDTPVKRYSSGMYVRLAFAVAAHLEPEILIVDEVLAVGDAAFQKKCLGKMEDVAKGGRTVLFVSHNMTAVQNLCKVAYLINQGRIIEHGDVTDVIARYAQTLNDATDSSLLTRTDRRGNGKIMFIDFSISGPAGDTNAIACGTPASFSIKYQGTGPLRNVHISLAFYNSRGEGVAHLSNDVTGALFDNLPSSGTFVCDFSKLPLLPDTYTVNLYCTVSGVLADWVVNAARIYVIEGDYFGTGKLPPKGYGAIVVPHKWDVIKL
jgi:lipopolysaccharide transport system ATP-binding protein